MADAQAAFDLKNKSIKKEEETIKDLHIQLENLEREKKSLEEEITDLTAKETDPAPKNRSAPKWAAIDKKQNAYARGMEEYRTQQRAIDEEYRYLKEVKLEELRKKIEEKESEILLLNEKIKIKLKIVRERQAKIERYEPEPGDWVDQKFAEYFNVPGKRVPIQRMEQNEYMFGTLRVSARPNPS